MLLLTLQEGEGLVIRMLIKVGMRFNVKEAHWLGERIKERMLQTEKNRINKDGCRCFSTSNIFRGLRTRSKSTMNTADKDLDRFSPSGERFIKRSWAKNQAIEQIAPILANTESSRAKEDALQAKIKELKFELKAKTMKLQDLEWTHKSETTKLQAENREQQALRTKVFNLEEANKKAEEKIKHTLADYSALEQDFEGKSLLIVFKYFAVNSCSHHLDLVVPVVVSLKI